MNGTGVISAEDAISYGITGPFLRSTGADYDVRKDCPYAVYDRLPFENDIGAVALAGWTTLAPICGALQWRPHVWLTGASGSGPSMP